MRFCGVNGCTKFPDHSGEHDPAQRTATLEPRMYAEESVRADRITPEVMGRRVLISTTEGAAISGMVNGYVIHAERYRWDAYMYVAPIRWETKTYVEFTLVGVENTVTVNGESEVKVLA